jgi:hypothetical protein
MALFYYLFLLFRDGEKINFRTPKRVKTKYDTTRKPPS